MPRMRTFFVALCVAVTCNVFAAEPGAVPEPKKGVVKDDPKLPHVLIIGDSISIGYTPELIQILKGKANIYHNAANGGPTTNGVKNIDDWLVRQKWDVIHFNFGLHDLKTTTGGKDSQPYPGGHQVTPEDYEKNLREIVGKMKKTDAKLIWASTTPVPEGPQNPGRVKGDDVLYNQIAAKVMSENNIPIDDLYNLVLPKIDEVQLKKNVHFTKLGYRLLAEQVAAHIEKALDAKK